MSHVVVIGAGIVGACTALELLRDGHQVTILEPGEPGGEQAASYGNGCWLSPMSVVPPSMPGLWLKIPGYLWNPLGPLAIHFSYLPHVIGWLRRYLRAGRTEKRVQRIAHALRSMLRGAPALHAALAEEAGVGHLIQRRGLMYIYPTRKEFEAEAMAWRIRYRVGIAWREVDTDELYQREPQLDRRYTFGILVEEGGHCLNPGEYVAALVVLAQAQGAVLQRGAATGFRIEARRLKAVLTADGEVPADRAVICAGARSKALARAAGNNVPLETERGYHAEVQDTDIGPRTPLMPSDGKMSITLTNRGLRVSGQVEIAGLGAAPNWKRAAILRNHLLRSFPELPRDLPEDRVKFWMGHRPSMPDGLPCLGVARASSDIFHGYGHGHVGLVAAPRTGRLLAQLIGGRAPEIDPRPYAPTRFK